MSKRGGGAGQNLLGLEAPSESVGGGGKSVFGGAGTTIRYLHEDLGEQETEKNKSAEATLGRTGGRARLNKNETSRHCCEALIARYLKGEWICEPLAEAPGEKQSGVTAWEAGEGVCADAAAVDRKGEGGPGRSIGRRYRGITGRGREGEKQLAASNTLSELNQKPRKPEKGEEATRRTIRRKNRMQGERGEFRCAGGETVMVVETCNWIREKRALEKKKLSRWQELSGKWGGEEGGRQRTAATEDGAGPIAKDITTVCSVQQSREN